MHRTRPEERFEEESVFKKEFFDLFRTLSEKFSACCRKFSGVVDKTSFWVSIGTFFGKFHVFHVIFFNFFSELEPKIFAILAKFFRRSCVRVQKFVLMFFQLFPDIE